MPNSIICSQVVLICFHMILTIFFSTPSSALLPPLLALTPRSRQIFSRHRFSVQCAARTSSTRWKLWHFSPERKNKTHVCPQLGGAVGVNTSDRCIVTADRENGGLYWCEEAAGRSHAVNITVSCESSHL